MEKREGKRGWVVLFGLAIITAIIALIFCLMPLLTGNVTGAGLMTGNSIWGWVQGLFGSGGEEAGMVMMGPANSQELPCYVGPKTIRAYNIAETNRICLVWPANEYRFELQISRRIYSSHPDEWQTWVDIHNVTNQVNESGMYCDTNVGNGIHYEYQISQFIINYSCDWRTNMPYKYYQYINTGTEVPLIDQRDKVILLVESSLATPLSSEITRLENDLIGDGYKVYRHNVSAVDVNQTGWKTAVSNTKAIIQSEYNTDINGNWSIFIVGHVPVPYAGLNSPGGHETNFGAHPADWYYADVNESLWTDTTASWTNATSLLINNISLSHLHQENVPGDGKFDQSRIPSAPEFRIGRIDLRNMPAFGKSEIELIRQYLDRNHAWRHKQFTARDRGLVNSNHNAGLLYGYQPHDSYDIHSSFFGSTYANTDVGSWLNDAVSPENSYMFAASAGNGLFTEDPQIGTTEDFAATPLYIVFATMHGSYYGHWDSAMHPDIVIQAPLSSEGYVLSNYYHEEIMNIGSSAMGEPIGQELYAMASSKYVTPLDVRYREHGWIYNKSSYFSNYIMNNYVTLLGDPTLRMRVVAPPSNVMLNVDGSDNIISWTSAVDTNIAGYHVYRAPAGNLNDFTRITSAPVTTGFFRNVNAAAGSYKYMVRTVKLEQSASRSYYSASQGIFTIPNPFDCSRQDIICVNNSAGLKVDRTSKENATIQECADSVRPGDTCLVWPGNYPEYVYIRGGGNDDKRVTFKAAGNAVVKGFYIMSSSIIIDGFNITGQKGLYSAFISSKDMKDTSDVHIWNNNIHDGITVYSEDFYMYNEDTDSGYFTSNSADFLSAGFSTGDKFSARCDYNVSINDFNYRSTLVVDSVSKNRLDVHNYSSSDSPPYNKGPVPCRLTYHISGIYLNAVGFSIINNTISNIWDNFITLQNGSKDGIIEGNELKNINKMDVFATFGRNLLYKNNFIHDSDNLPYVGNHPDFVQTFGYSGPYMYEAYNVTFEGNWIQNINSQITMLEQNNNPKIGNWVFRNNVFVNISENAYIMIPGVQFIGNTFYRAAYDMSGMIIGSTLYVGEAYDTVIKNNVFLENGALPEETNSFRGFYMFNGGIFGTLSSITNNQTLISLITQDMVKNGYIVNANGDLTNKARSLTDISQFNLSSEFDSYKTAVYNELIRTVVADKHARDTSIFNYNYVAGAVSAGFLHKRNYSCDSTDTYELKWSFCELNGINGGDPKLQNLSNPIGPDGIPFTYDDGLIPLNISPLCGNGSGGSDIGAYPCQGSPECGNGVIEFGEECEGSDTQNCPSGSSGTRTCEQCHWVGTCLASVVTCPNQICDYGSGEDCNSCWQDCGACSEIHGDGGPSRSRNSNVVRNNTNTSRENNTYNSNGKVNNNLNIGGGLGGNISIGGGEVGKIINGLKRGLIVYWGAIVVLVGIIGYVSYALVVRLRRLRGERFK